MSEASEETDANENSLIGKGQLVQGLKSNTLVAGKTTALKLYCTPTNAERSYRITLDISGPRYWKKTLEWFRDDTTWDPFYAKFQLYYDLFINQPYLVGRIRGKIFLLLGHI